MLVSSFPSGSAGVPQGTKLGPLLFLIMINDLAVSDETVKFVDDTSLWMIPLTLPAVQNGRRSIT